MKTTGLEQLGYTVAGATTSVGIGQFFLDSLGALLIGLLGAAGAYIFARWLKPYFDTKFPRKPSKKAE